MKYYIELQLLPNDEVNLSFIWQKAFQQVHIALVEHGYESERKLKHGDTKILRNSKIAVSFPEYEKHRFPLGSKLRLFAQTREELEKLDIQTWLNRLTDYVEIGGIKATPENASPIVFAQKRVKGVKRTGDAVRRKEKYLAQKFGDDLDPTRKALSLKKTFEKCQLPFIRLESQSTKKRGGNGIFQIFIEKRDANESAKCEYDCYGLALSSTATVPWF